MSENSSIEWCDTTWNPILDQPFRWRGPRRVFVNSLADLFHKNVPAWFIADVFAVMAVTPQHTYQLLTKQHARMRSLLNSVNFRLAVMEKARGRHPGRLTPIWPIGNLWLGVSVENQYWARRIPALIDTPAAVRFLSCEPMLGPVDLRYAGGIDALKRDWIGGTGAPHPLVDWVICGGESGPNARPMHPGWARKIRDDCERASVPFFFKQWGEWGPAPFIVRVCDPATGWQGTEAELAAAKARAEAQGATHVHTGNSYRRDGETVWHVHKIGHKPWSIERVGLPDGMEPIRRWGKKAAGRELDGHTWDEFPAAAELVPR